MNTIPAESLIFTFGADPEMFAKDARGTPRSLIGKIGGSKDYPLKIKNGAIQEDNVSGEMNIDPVDNRADFIEKMVSVRENMYRRIRAHGLKPMVVPHAFFPAEELQHPNAAAFGCTPDFDIWTGEINPAPTPRTDGLRTGAGHIHIGYKKRNGEAFTDKEKEYLLKKTVLLADLYLGVPSIVLDPAVERRQMYGKSGVYRHKVLADGTYVIEYRTLSNFWIKNKTLIGWVFDQAYKVATLMPPLTLIRLKYGVDPQTIRNAINTSDVGFASNFVETRGVIMP